MDYERIAVIGTVAAGSPSEWIPIKKWRLIRPLDGLRPGEIVYGLEVSGRSLVGKNILHGDILIFVFGRQARPGDLCVVQTPYGLTAKFVHPNDEGEVILKSANVLVPDQCWLCEEVKVLGVVKRVERDL